MSAPFAVALFAASLSVTLWAARSFARRLDRIGARFGLPEAVIGLLTAIGADGPEISSALVALAKGAHSTSVGVLVGSNVFNLAAMVGVSALLTGSVALSRRDLAPEGALCAAVTAIVSAVLLRWIGAVAGALLALAAIVPYGLWLRRAERRAVAHVGHQAAAAATRQLPALVVVDAALIIGGSIGMVQSALSLSGRWGISQSLLGALILGPLTSIPNAVTAIRLGLAGRSTALVGETFNSNAINLAIGVTIPALFVSVPAPSATGRLEIALLVAMTAATLLALSRRRGIRRVEAAALIVAYAGFVAIVALG